MVKVQKGARSEKWRGGATMTKKSINERCAGLRMSRREHRQNIRKKLRKHATGAASKKSHKTTRSKRGHKLNTKKKQKNSDCVAAATMAKGAWVVECKCQKGKSHFYGDSGGNGFFKTYRGGEPRNGNAVNRPKRLRRPSC